MYQTPSVTNLTNKVNRTNGRPRSPQVQTARCQRQPNREPVKDILCFLGPRLACSPAHSELPPHLRPHHHIRPPDGPPQCRHIISFTLRQWHCHTSAHHATCPHHHSSHFSCSFLPILHVLPICMLSLVRHSQLFVT